MASYRGSGVQLIGVALGRDEREPERTRQPRRAAETKRSPPKTPGSPPLPSRPSLRATGLFRLFAERRRMREPPLGTGIAARGDGFVYAELASGLVGWREPPTPPKKGKQLFKNAVSRVDSVDKVAAVLPTTPPHPPPRENRRLVRGKVGFHAA